MTRRLLTCLLLALCLSGAARAMPEDAALDARTHKLSAELRCLVCQNQSLADSHAGLALDLRHQVRDMLRAGRSEREVVDYLTARYGDFVVYKPPFKASTALLWAGPLLLLAAAAGAVAVVLRRRSRLDASAFDDDPTAEGTGA